MRCFFMLILFFAALFSIIIIVHSKNLLKQAQMKKDPYLIGNFWYRNIKV